MKEMELQKLLYRVSETAEILSIARSKAYLMIQTGELPSIRLGKSVRVPAAALHRWVEENSSPVVRLSEVA